VTVGFFALGTTRPARRALAEQLPRDVAVAAAEFITGPLLRRRAASASSSPMSSPVSTAPAWLAIGGFCMKSTTRSIS